MAEYDAIAREYRESKRLPFREHVDTPGHWRVGADGDWGLGFGPQGRVAAAEVDGDGRADLIVPLVEGSRVFVLVPATAVVQNGNAGGTVAIESVATVPGAYSFHSRSPALTGFRCCVGLASASAGDIDGDGLEDVLLAVVADGDSAAYLIVAANLEPLDAADGARDGRIDLGSIAGARRE